MIKKNLGDALAKVQNYENKIKDLTGDNEEKNKKLIDEFISEVGN